MIVQFPKPLKARLHDAQEEAVALEWHARLDRSETCAGDNAALITAVLGRARAQNSAAERWLLLSNWKIWAMATVAEGEEEKMGLMPFPCLAPVTRALEEKEETFLKQHLAWYQRSFLTLLTSPPLPSSSLPSPPLPRRRVL